ncbi:MULTISPECIES: protamine-2 (modular protein) [Mesorhizobium]|jgi:hypothetical protein|uniref:Protamine-2 (Modular protein) n=1 Tax=Rhizobium loti TaxID=381 RepID=A0A8E2WBP1_RHILI|nr:MULTISPECIES: protamine-2 (modular protein) [Mesorhizobium]AZO41007.1 protamine-2 (modular protein) [Mesorhizobium sp. M7D.F.Ca.US.005.01.1.1]PWJ90857.1 hypothetical protein C8D77_104199 [Mesorhizobium loti]RUX91024.1 protamine-2 (modular protein) [Mesorhizobium sp. M7D.F.Ca.US.004.01.2.1]RVA22107.1 protamine-2 (modular protein) [Mesorhizobium sp. M7D.F.Ca.US.004.03.1.1]
MDRRLLLTGMLGLAGAATVIAIARPAIALAGIPNKGPGILDELDKPSDAILDQDGPDVQDGIEPVRWYRRRRRRGWRRVCRRYWRHGYWRRRCFRRSFWIRF